MKPLTGLFLGAGASCEAGMPLAWELTGEIKNWLTPPKLRELNAGWRLQGGGHCDAVINDCISVLERADVHYEAVLGYLKSNFAARERWPRNTTASIPGWSNSSISCCISGR